mmetsp:Transcript_121512/g.350807  ORF Transcript_121512/g.350807 Transcript_121512/m.350807 type:complete len:276 (+) Transcript_121512:728-1555(+)
MLGSAGISVFSARARSLMCSSRARTATASAQCACEGARAWTRWRRSSSSRRRSECCCGPSDSPGTCSSRASCSSSCGVSRGRTDHCLRPAAAQAASATSWTSLSIASRARSGSAGTRRPSACPPTASRACTGPRAARRPSPTHPRFLPVGPGAWTSRPWTVSRTALWKIGSLVASSVRRHPVRHRFGMTRRVWRRSMSPRCCSRRRRHRQPSERDLERTRSSGVRSSTASAADPTAPASRVCGQTPPPAWQPHGCRCCRRLVEARSCASSTAGVA